MEAFNAADLDALVSMYEPNASLLVNGEPAVGHDQIRAALQVFLDRKGQMIMNTRLVFESSEGLALLNGSWLLESGGTGTGVVTHGLSSEVVRRQADGTWLFVLDNPFTPEP